MKITFLRQRLEQLNRNAFNQATAVPDILLIE